MDECSPSSKGDQPDIRVEDSYTSAFEPVALVEDIGAADPGIED